MKSFSETFMPPSRDVRPLTNDQAVQLRRDLTLVEERLQDIAILLRVCYGEDSQVVDRADETAAALQRLKWALERTKVQESSVQLEGMLPSSQDLRRGLLHRDPDC